jgi:hypothetical protein
MSKSVIYAAFVFALCGCGGGGNSIDTTLVNRDWESLQAALQSSISVATGMLTLVTSQSE